MFYSAVQEAAHLNWFLVLLRDGLRTKRDLDVLIESDFLNIIMFIFKRSSINERVIFRIFLFFLHVYMNVDYNNAFDCYYNS